MGVISICYIYTADQVEETPRIDSFELPMDAADYVACRVGCHTQLIYALVFGDICRLFPKGNYKGISIQLSRKRNGYGGEQVFFLCPVCGGRVRYLYWVGGRFLCRKCAHLNYASQQKTKDVMTDFYLGMAYVGKHLKPPAHEINGFSFARYIPERPKGMHNKTYVRHLKKFKQYQERYNKRSFSEFSRLFGRIKKGGNYA